MTQLSVTTQGDREIVMSRLFTAPPQLLFEAHTVPALMRRWFTGPDGWTLAVCEVDLRPGGDYRHVWRNADGREMGMGGTYREVDAPHRLVASELFDEDWTGGETLNTQTFAAVGDGHCLVTTTTRYSSAEARDRALQSNMEAGVAASYARLDALLAGVPIEQDA